MRIRTQMRLGLGLLLVLLVLVAAVAWQQTHVLWLETKTLYEHPLQVRRVVDDLKYDVLLMRLEFRNLLLAVTEEQRKEALANTEVYAKDAEQQFSVLYHLYRGPRLHLDAAQEAFVRWRSTRRDNQDLARQGNVQEAMARVGEKGDIGVHRTELHERLKVIDDFTRKDADMMYASAAARKRTLNHQLAGLTGLALFLAIATSYLLNAHIRTPLRGLTETAEQFRKGNLDARCGYSMRNEFGALSDSFNGLAEGIQAQMRSKDRVAQVAKVMLRETEAHAFFRELLKSLAAQTNSQVGAAYLLNNTKDQFEHFESIGADRPARESFSALNPEGEFGLAVASGQLQVITAIPEDTRFSIATTTGDFRPKEILTIPLRSGDAVTTVLSLASAHSYSAAALALVKDTLGTMTARAEGVLAFRQIQKMADRLERQNQQLEAQRKELTAQAEELTLQNSELEIQKRQLDEANRLKSAFLSSMSHELRTPLNSVIALSGVLNRRLSEKIPSEEHEYLGIIERNGKHLLTLINDILDLSRLEAGREVARSEPFSLTSVIDEVVATVKPQADEKQIELRNLSPSSMPMMVSDALKCRHIVQNLVGNAVKFTDAGFVEVSSRVVDGEVEISVRDTGTGIPPEHLPHIFDEFRQGDSTTSRKYGGTGLGLAIARRYASLLQGSIAVQTALGKGSTFTLRLPVSLSTDDLAGTGSFAPIQRSVAAGKQSESCPGRRILIVEDNEPAVVQIREILVSEGYNVVGACTGRDALAQIEAQSPDALILDLMMPEVDGFEVLKKLRLNPRTKLLPVLVLTAKHVSEGELSMLESNQIQQIIQKGDISKSQLLRAVANMINNAAVAPTA